MKKFVSKNSWLATGIHTYLNDLLLLCRGSTFLRPLPDCLWYIWRQCSSIHRDNQDSLQKIQTYVDSRTWSRIRGLPRLSLWRRHWTGIYRYENIRIFNGWIPIIDSFSCIPFFRHSVCVILFMFPWNIYISGQEMFAQLLPTTLTSKRLAENEVKIQCHHIKKAPWRYVQIRLTRRNEPPQEKKNNNKMTVLPAKIQISLDIRPVWSESSLALNGELRTQAFIMRTAKTLIRLNGCPGWSESSLGAQSFCWFCHGAVQMSFLRSVTRKFMLCMQEYNFLISSGVV